MDYQDFLILSQNFGPQDVGKEQDDANGDRRVDFGDFLLLSGSFDG